MIIGVVFECMKVCKTMVKKNGITVNPDKTEIKPITHNTIFKPPTTIDIIKRRRVFREGAGYQINIHTTRQADNEDRSSLAVTLNCVVFLFLF